MITIVTIGEGGEMAHTQEESANLKLCLGVDLFVDGGCVEL
jgi:hypothetical protein